ncbi:MAG: hypothetical protein LAN71_12800 [Acidobacteriia bacterium]|nr:hypothetical protein [Terriglobia bacterium]
MSLFEEQLGEWKTVSRGEGVAWLSVYGLFLLYAANNRSGFLFPDYVNLIIHEAGHLFFSWFGRTVTILGGTLGELLVPLLCAAYFACAREVTGFTFASFWFFENFPYIGVYMTDARAQALPLVSVGGGGDGDEHDWRNLFGQWGLLAHDRQIGGLTVALGWMGMLAVVAWFAWRVRWRVRAGEDGPGD